MSVDRAAFRRHLRKRALLDAIAIALAAFAVTQPVANPHDSLLLGIATVGLGMMLFIVRRNRDFAHFVQAVRQRERALDGSGISLAEWHQGKPLRPWQERQPAPAAVAE